MPAIFVGHGSPMLALEDSTVTRTLAKVGQQVINKFGKPKAILMVSAHWYKAGNLIQKTPHPKQVFDMYGFPRELYEVKYELEGSDELSEAVLALQDLGAKVDNTWGIDHGTWTTLIHMFPDADIPVVQLSVNGVVTPQQSYEIGKKLSQLRDQGFMVMGSGNIVHNLREVEWDNAHGTPQAETFNDYITAAVERRDDDAVIRFKEHALGRYAAPTPEHFLPLLYVLGASEGEKPIVFNKLCNLGTMAMTGFVFEGEG
ncbi:MAG: 4,5-DOPA dioxygenase extradiol [Prevotella sp.]|nr:4,5-DOPA dioxygenase extradiol [Prevotella sp.]